MREDQKLGLKTGEMGNKSRTDAGFSGAGRNPIKAGVMKGHEGKDRKRFE